MKKILAFLAILSFLLSYAQVTTLTQKVGDVTISSEKRISDELYTGGNAQFVKDLETQFQFYAVDYQLNSKYLLTFQLDEEGKINDANVFPDVTNNKFKYEMVRTLKRLKNNFKASGSTTKMAVLLDFNYVVNSPDNSASTSQRATMSYNDR